MNEDAGAIKREGRKVPPGGVGAFGTRAVPLDSH